MLSNYFYIIAFHAVKRFSSHKLCYYILYMINFIVIVSILALGILTYFKGARIMLTAIMAFYPASMLYKALPWQQNLLFLGKKGNSLFYSHLLLFAIIFVILFFILYRVTQNEGLSIGIHRGINAALLSIGVVLAIIALSFHILPTYDIFQLGSKAQNFWASDMGYFVAILAPLFAIWRVSRS